MITVRFFYEGKVQFGHLDRQTNLIDICVGDMFGEHKNTGAKVALSLVEVLAPCRPQKMLGLWNNFHERAVKESLTKPAHPLYFVKTENCYSATEQDILQPASYTGPVVYEGELGIVIGKVCHMVSLADADDYIFGYTLVNDVTARGILKSEPTFPQWVRSKSFDTFGPFGPAIVSGIDPDNMRVITRLNGQEVQNYPVSDMFYGPRELVSLISRDMTLQPGDVIACGTSVGAGPMPNGSVVEVEVAEIGILRNRFI